MINDLSSVAEPDLGSSVFLTPGWVKNQDLDPGSESVMNNLDHISTALKTIF